MKALTAVCYTVYYTILIALLLLYTYLCVLFPIAMFALIVIIPVSAFLIWFPLLLKKVFTGKEYQSEVRAEYAKRSEYDRAMFAQQIMQERASHEQQIQKERAAYEEQIRKLSSSEQPSRETVISIYKEARQLLSWVVPRMDGVFFERYVANGLRMEGFTQITFTPKTGDYGADIIAVDSDGRRTCIQCKRYSESVGVDAVQEVFSGKAYYNCERAIVITNSTFTPAAKELATGTGTELRERFS